VPASWCTPPGRGAVLCARVFSDSGDAVRTGLSGQGPRGGAQSPVPAFCTAHAAREGHRIQRHRNAGRANARWEGRSPLRPCFVERRSRCPSKGSIQLTAQPPAPVFFWTARTPSLPVCAATRRGEGHSPLCPLFFRTAGTPSLPADHRGMGTIPRAHWLVYARGGVTVPPDCLFHHGGCPTGLIGRKEMDWPGCDC